MDAPITNRQAYAAAATVGKSGPEIEKVMRRASRSTRSGPPSRSLMELRKCLRCGGYGTANLHECFEIGEDGRIIAVSHAQATNAGALDHKGRV